MAWTEGSPEDVGMSSPRLERVRRSMREWAEKVGQHGVCAVVARRGVVVLDEAFVRLRAEPDSPPVRPDTIFWLASISKVVCATAAMVLVEEGRLGLNHPVSIYVPEFVGEKKEAVRVLHLLTHTSGLRDEDADEYAKNNSESASVRRPERTENPELAAYMSARYGTPLGKDPGVEMCYSTFGMDLLGEAVRRVSGQSFADFVAERICRPLGMNGTAYGLPESRRASAAQPGEAEARSLMEYVARVPHPGGAAFSTARDLARFGQMFLDGGRAGGVRVLSPTTVAAMTRNQIPGLSSGYADEVFREGSWGFGWSVLSDWKGVAWGLGLSSRRAYCHSGMGLAFLWVDPEYELVGAYLPAEDTSRLLGRYPWEIRRNSGAFLFADAVTAAIVD